jgi:hypothetical protein
MREINIGNQVVRVRATTLALLFYKQEFKSDLLGDLMKMGQVAEDPSKLEVLSVLQLIWAMSKADSYGKQFPSFETWLGSLENIDFSDASFMTAAMEEAADGFFRTGVKGAVQK